MNIKETIIASFKTLSRKERRRIAAVAVIQVGLGFLDLVGVAIIGVIGSLAVNGIQSRAPGTRIAEILEFLGLEGFTFQTQVAILGTGAVVKRPVAVTDNSGADVIAIRSMVYLALSYDHRLVDGADAARFLSSIKARLEDTSFDAELGL